MICIRTLYEKELIEIPDVPFKLMKKQLKHCFNLIHNKIDSIPKNEISGIYVISFTIDAKENRVNIRKIRWKFKDGLKGHIGDIKFNRWAIAFWRPSQKQNLNLCFNKTKIIISKLNYRITLIKVSIKIQMKESS